MLCSCGKNPYDNKTDKNDLITNIYSEDICNQIQYRIGVGGLHIDGLREIVDVECLRKTEKGSYAVLKLDNEKFAYIIIDENNMCTRLYQFTESFPSRAELEESLKTAKYSTDFFALSPNFMCDASSNADVVVCPVHEGYVVAVFFKEELEGRALTSVEFYVDIADSSLWRSAGITQILDIDRCKP